MSPATPGPSSPAKNNNGGRAQSQAPSQSPFVGIGGSHKDLLAAPNPTSITEEVEDATESDRVSFYVQVSTFFGS